MARDRFRTSETDYPTDEERVYLESILAEIGQVITQKFGSQSLTKLVTSDMKAVAIELSDEPLIYNVRYLHPVAKIERDWHRYEESIQKESGKILMSRKTILFDHGPWIIITPNPLKRGENEKISAHNLNREIVIQGMLSAQNLDKIVSERQLSNPELDNYQLIDSLKSLPGNPNLH